MRIIVSFKFPQFVLVIRCPLQSLRWFTFLRPKVESFYSAKNNKDRRRGYGSSSTAFAACFAILQDVKLACRCFKKRSAIGEKVWYFFQIRYRWFSSTGDNGRKTTGIRRGVDQMVKGQKVPKALPGKHGAVIGQPEGPLQAQFLHSFPRTIWEYRSASSAPNRTGEAPSGHPP